MPRLPQGAAAQKTRFVVRPPLTLPVTPAPDGSDDSASEGNVAVLVTHGMGQQVSYETLDLVAKGLCDAAGGEQKDGWTLKPERGLRHVRIGEEDLRRIELTFESRTTNSTRQVHLYEAYWAPLTEGKVTLRDSIGFLVRGGANGLKNSVHGVKRWMFHRAVTLHAPRSTSAILIALATIASLAAMNLVAAMAVLQPGSLRAETFGAEAGYALLAFLVPAMVFGATLFAAKKQRQIHEESLRKLEDGAKSPLRGTLDAGMRCFGWVLGAAVGFLVGSIGLGILLFAVTSEGAGVPHRVLTAGLVFLSSVLLLAAGSWWLLRERKDGDKASSADDDAAAEARKRLQRTQKQGPILIGGTVLLVVAHGFLLHRIDLVGGGWTLAAVAGVDALALAAGATWLLRLEDLHRTGAEPQPDKTRVTVTRLDRAPEPPARPKSSGSDAPRLGPPRYFFPAVIGGFVVTVLLLLFAQPLYQALSGLVSGAATGVAWQDALLLSPLVPLAGLFAVAAVGPLVFGMVGAVKPHRDSPSAPWAGVARASAVALTIGLVVSSLLALHVTAFVVGLWSVVFALSLVVRHLIVQYPGDVAAYVSPHTLNRFYHLREEIKATVKRTADAIYSARTSDGKRYEYRSVILVAHSLGSVVTYDILNALIKDDQFAGDGAAKEAAKQKPKDPAAKATPRRRDIARRTPLLLTFGSPLDRTAFVFATRAADMEAREPLAMIGQPLIESYKHRAHTDWINYYSEGDILGSELRFYDDPEVAGGRKVDNRVDPTATTPLLAHTELWYGRLVWAQLRRSIVAAFEDSPPGGPPPTIASRVAE